MTNLTTVDEIKTIRLTPNTDGTYNKEDIQNMLNNKGEYYKDVLKELEKMYKAIGDQDQQHKQDIQKYEDKIKEYDNNSQLLTQLTMEARSNLNKSKEKSERTLQEAEKSSNEIINDAHNQARDIINEARKHAQDINDQKIKELNDYENHEKNRINEEVEKIRNNAYKHKVQQEDEINKLREQTLENNNRIIQEGSDKAKSLIMQAQNKSSEILDDAQKQYDEISGEINEIRKAGMVFTKNIEDLITSTQQIQNLDSYQMLKDIKNKHEKSSQQQSQNDKKYPETLLNDTLDNKEKSSQKIEKKQFNFSNNTDVSNVLNDDNKLDINVSSLPKNLQDGIKNSLQLQRELTDENRND